MLRWELVQHPLFAPALGLIAALIAAFIFKPLLIRWLRRLAEANGSKVLPALVHMLDRYLTLWIFLAAAAAVASAAALETGHRSLIHSVIRVLFLTSATWAFVRLLSETAGLFGREMRTSPAHTRLFSRLMQLVVIIIGAMLVLQNLGISITPLLTALGVSSLAVALALQDTLGNFFAGILTVASRVVEPGDHIKLDSGQEGTVVEIGWRVSLIKDGSNNLLFVPNLKLSQSIVTNFHKPDAEVIVQITVDVPFETDLRTFESLAFEAAREAQQTQETLKDYQPVVRYQSFGGSGASCSVSLKAQRVDDRALLIHEFLIRLHARMREAKMNFPAARRVVETRSGPLQS